MTSVETAVSSFRSRVALAALVLLTAGAAWAQDAGRIVLAVGEVVAVRGAERIPLAAGAIVSVGDAVVTGAQSHAQLRFSDASLVALRPDSEFRIEQYAFTGSADGSERAVFRLVRGGFRTLTGQIGLVNRDTYQVLTTQATIGIRGTHFALLICSANQCREVPDAPALPPGLMGGVFEGRLGVATAFGSDEYGEREYFYVPDGGAPRRLLVPPPFLTDTMEIRTVRERRPTDAPPTGELRLARVPAIPLDPWVPVPPSTYQLTDNLNFEPFVTPTDRTIVVGSDQYTLELARTTDPGLALGFDSEGRLLSFVNANLTANVGTASIVDAGNDNGDTGLNWGRWNGPGSTIVQRLPGGETVRNDGGNLHYIYGPTATALPGAGVFSYSPFANTTPTDSGTGATGQLVSGGTMRIDFGQATATLTGLAVGFTNATYTMSGTTPLVGGLFSTAGTGATAGCTGNGCRPLVAGNFVGFLSGPGGTGIGLDYYFNTRGGGVIEGVVGYRRCAAAGC